MRVILASQSPRRRELMGTICPFEARSTDADETLPQGILPRDAVELLARRKAEALRETLPEVQRADTVIIGADTIVYLDGALLGKPADARSAREMLEALSGRRHTVFTGVALLCGKRAEVFACETEVEFYPLSTEDIEGYIATGEPFDKAGGYGIQGRGALLVRGLYGDYYNVMGLPIAELSRRLAAFSAQDENQKLSG